MDKEIFILLIDKALKETDNVVAKSKFFRADKEPILSTKKVLNLLKDEIFKNNETISLIVLRAMHDVGMSSFKDFENTPLEDAINDVTAVLYNNIPEYKNLEPLRNDFGKGQLI